MKEAYWITSKRTILFKRWVSAIPIGFRLMLRESLKSFREEIEDVIQEELESSLHELSNKK